MSAGGHDRGLIYRSARLYELAMLAAYRRHYRQRYRVLAGLVPAGASVVELCCGPGILYLRYLKPKDVKYIGLDYNPTFVASLRGRGMDVRIQDLRAPDPLPGGDYLIMQASLYHFLPVAEQVVDRMLAAAAEQVIISEPIRNLTTEHPRLRRFLAHATDVGTGAQAQRFDEATLDQFFDAFVDRVASTFPLPGGREKVYLLHGARA